MRYWHCGEQTSDDGNLTPHDLVVMNVHMNYMTANMKIKRADEAIKQFWDEIAGHIVEFRVRILAGDWNMQFFCVIPELRARGIHINLAAWYPFAPHIGQEPLIDSMGLFIIGPVDGIKKVFDYSVLCNSMVCAKRLSDKVFDISSPNSKWYLKQEAYEDDRGVTRYRPHTLPKYTKHGCGHPLKSYHPKSSKNTDKKRKVEWIRQTFEMIEDPESPAVAEAKLAGREDREMFPGAPLQCVGDATHKYCKLPLAKGKLFNPEMHDPFLPPNHGDTTLLSGGAHNKVGFFLGANIHGRRSEAALQRRAKWSRHQSRSSGPDNNSSLATPVHHSRAMSQMSSWNLEDFNQKTWPDQETWPDQKTWPDQMQQTQRRGRGWSEQRRKSCRWSGQCWDSAKQNEWYEMRLGPDGRNAWEAYKAQTGYPETGYPEMAQPAHPAYVVPQRFHERSV